MRTETSKTASWVRAAAAPRPLIEALDARRLLSASLSSLGVLTVNGTASADVITVSVKLSKVTVVQNGATVGSYTPSAVKSVVVNGGAGNDSLQVLDTITVRATVNGGDGNDFLRGGAAADTLNGGNGNDTLDGSLGADVYNGNAGTDTADYSGRSFAVKVSLDGVANDGRPDIAEKDNVKGDLENVNGGSGNDTLIGNALANVLKGNAGNDHIEGKAGNDTLYGHAGNDYLEGWEGSDKIFGGTGSDDLYGEVGPSRDIYVVPSSDVLYGEAGSDWLDGGFGPDYVNGGADYDYGYADDADAETVEWLDSRF